MAWFDETRSAVVESRQPSPNVARAVGRYRWQVLLAVVIAAAGGYALSLLQAPVYESEASLILSDPLSSNVFQDPSASRDPSRYVRNQAEYIQSTQVAVRAAESLADGTTAADIRDHVVASASRDLDLVVIKATGSSPEEAARITDAVATAYVELTSEMLSDNAAAAIQELERAKAELQARASQLEESLVEDPEDAALQAERDAVVAQIISADTRIEQIAVNAALYGSGVQLYEPAELPDSPIRPRPLLASAAAALIAAFVAVALAWWRSERTPLALHRHDPAPILRVPLLGAIPEFDGGEDGRLAALTGRGSPAGEAYQFVVSALQFALRESEARTVVITSPRAGDGKTVTAMNLALAVMADGRKTLLVDADERARGISLAIGGDSDQQGLVDLGVKNRIAFNRCVTIWKASEGVNLPVITAGTTPTDTPAFFRSGAFDKAMDRIRSSVEAELILIDTPPLLAVAESSDIAASGDAILLVVQRGTPLHVLEEARDRIILTETPLIGYVFNRATPHEHHGYAGYYDYGYGARPS